MAVQVDDLSFVLDEEEVAKVGSFLQLSPHPDMHSRVPPTRDAGLVHGHHSDHSLQKKVLGPDEAGKEIDEV